VLEHRATEQVDALRRVADEGDVVLLDYTTNGDVADLAAPLSHAALIRRYVLSEWPD
jgi:hypothetical protein